MRSNGSWLQPPPAIAAITSTAPKVRSVNATSASTCERSVTSVRSARALPPSAVIAAAVACKRASSREATTTCAPAAANAVATPSLTLKPPPVTIATLPSRGRAVVIVAAVRSRGRRRCRCELPPHLGAVAERRLDIRTAHVGDRAVRVDVDVVPREVVRPIVVAARRHLQQQLLVLAVPVVGDAAR